MPDATGPELSAAFLPALLDLLPSGVVCYAPEHDAAGTVVDFRFAYLNPAAQRLLGLPARPTASYAEQFAASHTTGALAFYLRTYLSGAPGHCECSYPAGGRDTHFLVDARRVGDRLLVTYTATATPPRPPAPAARAEAGQATWQLALQQLPVAIAILAGPECVVAFANDRMGRLGGQPAASIIGRPCAEALPKLAGQDLAAVVEGVYRSGQPHYQYEQLVRLNQDGKLVPGYFDMVYQPLWAAGGEVTGVSYVASEVTAPVLARQQAQQLNAELQAANDLLAARVAERTREAEAAQQATEHQHALLQRVLEQAPVAIAILAGPTHRITFANARMAAIWGRPVTQVLGRPHFEALPDTAGQGLEAVFAGVFENGESATLSEQLTYLDRAGTGQRTAHYLHLVFEPLRNEQGRITGIIASALDVTELTGARQLVEEKERQASFLNEELQAANDEILTNNDELERTQAQLRELNEALEARVAERTHQLEAALQEAQQQREQLRVQQGLLSQILRQAPATIATLHGPEHRFTFFNEQYQQLANGRARLAGTVAELLPEVVAQGLVGQLDQVYATGQPYTVLEGAVQVLDPTSGAAKTVYLDYTYQPLRDAQGQVEGILAFSVDASARVLARQQVQHLNEELHARNQELTATNRQLTRTNADLDNFIYTASHDLKAPISNIEGLLNLLRELLPEPVRAAEQVAPVLGMMQGSVERFKRTIAHLTDVTKLQLEFAQPAVPVLLAAVVEDVRQDLLPLLTEAGAELEVAVDDCRPRVFSEKNLRSILYNLLSNSLKYRAASRPPQVRLACHVAGSSLVLSVQDNGLGLTAQQQSRLFQLFQRMHSHVEGSGLGLYMVKKIVENAGGTIQVQSQVNVGTTFTLTFPA